MKKSNLILLITLGVIIIMIISSLVYLRSVFNTEILRGEGNLTEVERTIDHFEKIKINGNYRVYFTQDNTTQLILAADENLHEYITTEVRNRELVISSSQPIRSSNDITLHLSSPELTALEASASAHFYTENPLQANDFRLLANAGSTVNMEGNFGSFSATQNAGSRVNLSGTARTLATDSNAGGTVDASGLIVESARANANAGGRIILNAKEIDATANAGGSVLYIGNPIIKNMSTNAGGNIRQTNR